MKQFFLRVMMCALMVALWVSGARADGSVKSLSFKLTPTGSSTCISTYNAAITSGHGTQSGQLVDNKLTILKNFSTSTATQPVRFPQDPFIPPFPNPTPPRRPTYSTTNSFTLALTGNQTINEGDVFVVGPESTAPSAQVTIAKSTRYLQSLESPVVTSWKAVSGQVRVVSKSASALTLQLTDVVAQGTSSSDRTTFNGTITATFNQAPTNIALSNASIIEHQAAGATIGTLSATDADADTGAGDTFTYALVAGEGDAGNSSFAISGDTLQTAEVFDAVTKSSYSIRVRVTDAAGATFEKSFEIAITAKSISLALTLTPAAPVTSDTLTVATTPQNVDNPTMNYEFRVNGEVKQSGESASFALGTRGNGDKGDVVSVVVTATDPQNGKSGSATAQVTVTNSAPVALSTQGTVPADTEKGFDLRGFDADGDALTFERVDGPRNGVTADIRLDPTDGKTKLFYKSRSFYNGVEVIRFVARDSEGAASAPSTLGIAVQYSAPPANRAPVVGDTFIDTYVNTLVIKGLLGSDPDGDALTFRIVNNAKYGYSEIKRDSDGKYRLHYTSLNRFYGDDRVTYLATDSRGKSSNVATIAIRFINRAPVAQNNRIGVVSGALISQYLLGSDDDNDALSFRLVNNPRYGAGAIKRDEQGHWRFYYQSVAGYVGPDLITFIAMDAAGKESQPARIDINVVRVGGANALSGGSS